MKNRLLLFLKGFAMGAADVVPGVSGGTIAFITGIYDELLASIKSVDLGSIRLIFKKGIPTFWKEINGSFLLILFSGIIVSVFSLARIIKYLLENEEILIWSFFFGLIMASVIYVGKQIEKWDVKNIIAVIIGAIVAYGITEVSPSSGIESWWYILLSGMIAICAMILPGISGSFILLLLGSYTIILGSISGLSDALSQGDSALIIKYGTYLALFAVGCVIGLASFSRLLHFLLQKHRNVTIAVLTGFMLGSLNKVWPWKKTLKTRINSKGEEVPWIQENISPQAYESLTGNESQLFIGIALAIVGIVLVLGLERLGKVKSE